MRTNRDDIRRMTRSSAGAGSGGTGGGASYALPLAADGTRGGVQVGYTTSASAKKYAVQLDNEKAYVNVPWTDHYAWEDITNKPSAAGGATTPVYWNGSGFTACTPYSQASVNYATTAGAAQSAGYATEAGSAGYAGYITDGTMDVIAQYNNEINFGGTNTDTTIYFGYRSRGKRPMPTAYVFGKDSAASIYCNYLYAASDVQVTSDERKKEVLGDVNLTVEQIAKMPSVFYRWKDGRDDNSIHIGTLAQKWELVLPQAVGIGDDEMKTRRFSYSLAAYAMGVAEAKEIEALKKEVRELREELKRFKSA